MTRNWLHLGYGWDLGVPDRAAYTWAEVTFAQALNDDPAWRAWWRTSRRRDLWLLPFFTPTPETAPHAKRGLRAVEVVLDVDSACLATEDRAALAELAVEHVHTFVGLAAEKLRLGPPPPWPELPPVPENLDEYAYEDDTPHRDEMREIFHEMGVRGDVEELLDGFGYTTEGRPPGR